MKISVKIRCKVLIRCQPSFLRYPLRALLIMLRHAIVFVAIPVLFDALKISSAQQLQDISSFIESLLQSEAKYNNGRDDRSQEVDEDKGYVAINSRELDELINQAANDVYSQNKNMNNHRNINPKWSNNYKIRYGHDKNYKQFLSSYSQRKPRNPSKAVFSHREVNPIASEPVNGQIFNDNDFKAYLIFNPNANLKQKDFKDISDLLLQVLSGSTNKKRLNNTGIKKERRYKGFVIADGSHTRRRNRESKEMYSPQDSLEDFKPKKVRSDYGGAGGRTPIPYIRHRDIYERD